MLVTDRGNGDRGKAGLGRQREAQQAVRDGNKRSRVAADGPQNLRMMGVKPAGQRSERGIMIFLAEVTKQRRETCRPLRCSRSFGWKWPEISWRASRAPPRGGG